MKKTEVNKVIKKVLASRKEGRGVENVEKTIHSENPSWSRRQIWNVLTGKVVAKYPYHFEWLQRASDLLKKGGKND